jgi:hypothetical protein
MILLIIFWLVGIVLVFGVFLAPSAIGGLTLLSWLYCVIVVPVCHSWASDLTADVRRREQELSTVRYGTITEKNTPLI